MQPSPDHALPTAADVDAAAQRLAGVALRTPLLTSPVLDALTGARVFLKAETLQRTGSFKFRGAYNKLSSIPPAERAGGVVAFSSGNHAQGVAAAARLLGMPAVIVMPADAPRPKRERTAALGAEVVLYDRAREDRQAIAQEIADKRHAALVPPYDDALIIAGQGTMGLEILEDVPGVETVLVPVGGGGMISGVAAAVKLSRPSVKVIGVEPALAADAQASFRAGQIVNFPAEEVTQTMADGLRTQSIGPINFEHIRNFVDDIVTVSEEEIREAMRTLAANPKTIAEPSGAVAVAGFLFHGKELPPRTIHVAVISGGNIEPAMLAEMRDKSWSTLRA